MDYVSISHDGGDQDGKRNDGQPDGLGHARTLIVRITCHEGIVKVL
jgi:hypothetical protein